MPQWDFLNFLAQQESIIRLFVDDGTEGIDLIEATEHAGVRRAGPDGELDIEADLVVGSDGRHSTIRARAAFRRKSRGADGRALDAPTRKKAGSAIALGIVGPDIFSSCSIAATIGSARTSSPRVFEAVKASGIEGLQRGSSPSCRGLRIASRGSTVGRRRSMLEVRVDRLEHWHRPGHLCIGDCGPRDVADRRRRHQPRDTRRRRDGKPSRRAPHSSGRRG